MNILFYSEIFQVAEFIRPVEVNLGNGIIAVQHRRIYEVLNAQSQTSAVLSEPAEVAQFIRQVHNWQKIAPSSSEVEAYLSRYDSVSLFPIIGH